MCWGHIPDEQGSGDVRYRLAEPMAELPSSSGKRDFERRRVPSNRIPVGRPIWEHKEHSDVTGMPTAFLRQQIGDESPPPVRRGEQVLLIDDGAFDFHDQERSKVLAPTDQVHGTSFAEHGEGVLNEGRPAFRLQQRNGLVDQRRVLLIEHSAQIRTAPARSEGQ
jgi:hypothetical protein